MGSLNMAEIVKNDWPVKAINRVKIEDNRPPPAANSTMLLATANRQTHPGDHQVLTSNVLPQPSGRGISRSLEELATSYPVRPLAMFHVCIIKRELLIYLISTDRYRISIWDTLVQIIHNS
jgi:hypothetical protein